MNFHKGMKYLYITLGCLSFLLGLIYSGKSIFEIELSGQASFILIPLFLLGVVWEILFGPSGSAMFSCICVALGFLYLAIKESKKKLPKPFVGPPRFIETEEQERSTKKGAVIGGLIFISIFMFPTVFIMYAKNDFIEVTLLLLFIMSPAIIWVVVKRIIRRKAA